MFVYQNIVERGEEALLLIRCRDPPEASEAEFGDGIDVNGGFQNLRDGLARLSAAGCAPFTMVTSRSPVCWMNALALSAACADA